MAAIQIFVDLTNRKTVANINGSAEKPFITPFHKDTLYWSIQPLTVNPSGAQSSTQYATVDAGGFALTVSVFTADGATLLATQSSWVADGQAKVGQIVLDTVPMTTAIASASSLATLVQMEFVGASETTTIEGTMTVKRSRIAAGTPVPIANETFLTTNEAMAIFVKYAGNPDGSSITLPNGGYELIIKCNADGSNASDAAV